MSGALKVGVLAYEMKLDKSSYESSMKKALDEAKTFGKNAGSAFHGLEGDAKKSFDGIAGSYRDANGRLMDENGRFLKDSKTTFDGVEKHAKNSANGMSGHFKTALAGIAGGLAALGIGQALSKATDVIKDSVKAASDQEQALGALDTVLGPLAPKVKDWATQQYKIGLSTTEAASGVTYLTSMLTNNGLALDESVDKSETLTLLAADMAAAFGGSTKDAIDAISAALRGETDPIERYGVSMKESTLQAYALEHGLTKTKGPLDNVTKAHAAYGIMLQQTNKIQGQATREQKTYEGQVNRLKAQWANTKASMGQAFIPVIVEMLEKLNGVMPQVGKTVTEWVPKIQTFLNGVFKGVKDNWPQIKETFNEVGEAVKNIGEVAKMVFDVFNGLPPELKQLILTGIIVKSAVPGGGLASNLVGNAAMAGGKSLLGMGGGAAASGAGGSLAGGAAGAGSAVASGARTVASRIPEILLALGAANAAKNVVQDSGKIANRSHGSAQQAGQLGLINGFDGLTFGAFNMNKTLDDSFKKIEENKKSIQESQKLSDKLRASGKNIPVNIDPKSFENNDSFLTSWWSGVKQMFRGWGGDLVNTLTFTFKEAVNGVYGFVKSVQDTVAGIFTGIGTSIRTAIGDAINWVSQKLQQTLSNVGNLVTAVPKTLWGGVKSTFGFANGGHIRGAGTSTSDSIPAWLSNGEYVLRASAVDRIGVSNLDRLNNGYATGGVVGGAGHAGGYTIGNVTVVAQDMNGFERSVRAKQRAASLGGRR